MRVAVAAGTSRIDNPKTLIHQSRDQGGFAAAGKTGDDQLFKIKEIGVCRIVLCQIFQGIHAAAGTPRPSQKNAGIVFIFNEIKRQFAKQYVYV
jgi:hypothetical protein